MTPGDTHTRRQGPTELGACVGKVTKSGTLAILGFSDESLRNGRLSRPQTRRIVPSFTYRHGIVLIGNVRAPKWVRQLERPRIVASGTSFCVTSDGGLECLEQVSELAVKGIPVLLREWVAVGAFRAVTRKPVLQSREPPSQTGHRTTTVSLCSEVRSYSRRYRHQAGQSCASGCIQLKGLNSGP
jgi:hypothetical protein